MGAEHHPTKPESLAQDLSELTGVPTALDLDDAVYPFQLPKVDDSHSPTLQKLAELIECRNPLSERLNARLSRAVSEDGNDGVAILRMLGTAAISIPENLRLVQLEREIAQVAKEALGADIPEEHRSAIVAIRQNITERHHRPVLPFGRS